MPGRYICPVLVGEDMTPRMVAVADRHVTLVASALPSHAAPVSGKFHGRGIQSGNTIYRFNRFSISQWECLSVVPPDNAANQY